VRLTLLLYLHLELSIEVLFSRQTRLVTKPLRAISIAAKNSGELL
jgi:hypothetical protein